MRRCGASQRPGPRLSRRGVQANGVRRISVKIWTTGKYGRPVVTAYDGDRDLHLELLEQGWAVAYRQYLPAPLKSAYLAVEADAKAAKRGLWQGKFIIPSAWRRGERLECEKR